MERMDAALHPDTPLTCDSCGGEGPAHDPGQVTYLSPGQNGIAECDLCGRMACEVCMERDECCVMEAA